MSSGVWWVEKTAVDETISSKAMCALSEQIRFNSFQNIIQSTPCAHWTQRRQTKKEDT